jgi:hypothetical protein
VVPRDLLDVLDCAPHRRRDRNPSRRRHRLLLLPLLLLAAAAASAAATLSLRCRGWSSVPHGRRRERGGRESRGEAGSRAEGERRREGGKEEREANKGGGREREICGRVLWGSKRNERMCVWGGGTGTTPDGPAARRNSRKFCFAF